MTQCIACTSIAIAKVVDGDHIKPVCGQHAKLYHNKGYVIIE